MGIHGRPHFSQKSMAGKDAAGGRRHHRLGRGRRPHGRDRRLRLHRDGRLDGHDRRAQGHAPSRDRAEAAHAADLAPRLGRRAHPGGGGLALRRLGPPLPRGGRDVGRRPDGRGDARPLRGGHRLHPRALGLRADGRRPGRDGARGPAPDEGRHGRGHLDGGPGRRQGPLPQVRRGRPRGQGRRRVHRGRSRPTSRSSRRTASRSRRSAKPRTPTTACRRSSSTSSPSRRATRTTCTT